MENLKKITRPFIITLLIFSILCGCSSSTSYFKNTDQTYDIMQNTLLNQKEVDAYLEEEMHNEKHTLEEPLVVLNPYGLAPLSALILFTTPEETPITLTINDTYTTSFASSKEHAIPVYGLYDGFDNEVLLQDHQGNTKTLTITTEPYEGGVMDVEKYTEGLNDEFYLVSPDYECTSAYEENGRLLWYLDVPDIEGAVIFLGNGHFLISDPYQGVGGIRINYSGFMDVDYLGKIHKLYIGEYGYHHEIVPIESRNAYLLPGHDEESLFMQANLYLVNQDTMQTISSLDFYELFHDLDPEWTDSLTKYSKFNFVINGVDYDEESGDALVSVRSFGMIIRINMETHEIKWIFADPEKLPEAFDQYLLTPIDGTRYPYGQHATTFLPNNQIAYHNNDTDFLKTEQVLSEYVDCYSSSEILTIDEEKKTVSTNWIFDTDKDILSKMSGSIEFIEDGHKLISYGSAFHKSDYPNPTVMSLMDFSKTSGLMMEIDDQDQIIWQATFPGVIHKVYKSSFYDNTESFPNYEIDSFQKLNGQNPEKNLGEPFDLEPISEELLYAKKLEGTITLSINRVLLATSYNMEDEVQILFVDEKDQGTIFTYKPKDSDLPIINSGKYGILVNGLSGKQKAYICISGTWYDTGTIFDFE